MLSSYPHLDLHGMDSEYALFKVKEFIDACYKLKYQNLIIVHGIGKGILSKVVNQYLDKDKRVLEHKIDFMNPGCTLVCLKLDNS